MKLPQLRSLLLLALLTAFSITLRAQPAAAPAAPAKPTATDAEAAAVTLDAPPKTGARDTKKWEKAIEAFEKSDTTEPPPKKGVLFIGSSTFKLWGKGLVTDFPEIPAINRGFGGSQMDDVVQYIDRIVIPYDPRVVVVYCGGNDLFYNKTPDQVLAEYKEFEAKVHAALPDTTIVFLSLNPTIKRLYQEPLVRELNAKTKDFVATKPKTLQIDSYSKMIGPDGQPQEKLLRTDKLHPSPEGYATFLSAIKPGIDQAYKDAGGTVK